MTLAKRGLKAPQSGSKPARHTSRGKEPRPEMERGP